MRVSLKKLKRAAAGVLAALMVAQPAATALGPISVFAADLKDQVKKTVVENTVETKNVKITKTEWDFSVNTGKTSDGSNLCLIGDDLDGIIIGSSNGNKRVYLDKEKDINIKNNGGMVYIPIKDDTTKVTIGCVPQDDDKSRYVDVAALGSGYTIYDQSSEPTKQSVTITDIEGKGLTTTVEGKEGRYIALVSGGNFKAKKLYIEESNICANVTVSGKISNWADFTDTGIDHLNFKNTTIKDADLIQAPVDSEGNYTVTLPNECLYVVSVDGEWLVDSTTSKFVLDSNYADAKFTKDVKINKAPKATVSGTISVTLSDVAVAFDHDNVEFSVIPEDDTLTPDVIPATYVSTENGVAKFTYEGLKLFKDMSYSIGIEGANDYIVNDAVKVTESVATANISVVSKPVYKVTATPVTSDRADVVVEQITFTNMNEDGYSYTFKTSDGNIAVHLRDGEYEVTEVVTDGNYTAYDHVSVDGADVSEDLYLVQGGETLYDLPSHIAKEDSPLVFTGVSANNATSVKGGAGATIVVPIDGKKKVTVAGWYSGTIDIDGDASTETTFNSSQSATAPGTVEYVTPDGAKSFTINFKGDVTTYLYYIKLVDMPDEVPYKATVKVGKGQEYKTVKEALTAVSNMNRPNGERVTLELTDELYREQIIVDIPNITFKGVNENGTTLTWYYGLGYNYYSVNPKTKMYDEAMFYDKYYKNATAQSPGNWGSTVTLNSGAAGFKAVDVTFENTFNRYVTEEEAIDGVECASLSYERLAEGADVTEYKAKERAAVLYNRGADDVEIYNCELLSAQDTLYTGDDNENIYFANCYIEGSTDYICGDGNAVFDQCTLGMYGYSDKEATGSYIVASKGKGKHGYLFSNCKIVTSKYAKDFNLQPVYDSYLARVWGAGARVNFMNTVVEAEDTIIAAGYTNMNATPEEAFYAEYNTYLPDGTPVDISGRHEAVKMLTKEEAAKVVMADYFDGFECDYLLADYTDVYNKLIEINKLNPEDYVNFEVVTTAVEAIEYGKLVAAQAEIKDIVNALSAAVEALIPDINGWILNEETGKLELYIHGFVVKNSWYEDEEGVWTYADENGDRVEKTWKKINNKWYFFGEEGAMAADEWVADGSKWYRVNASGAMMSNCWVQEGSTWYYLKASGVMVANDWVKSSGKWYWFNGSGKMVTSSWVKSSGKWYYVEKSGAMAVSKWLLLGDKYYYVNASGVMAANQWVKSSGKWYYVNGSGVMMTSSWVKSSGKWYYVDAAGAMKTNSWVRGAGVLYYVGGDGVMYTSGTYTINGKKYTFDSTGVRVK